MKECSGFLSRYIKILIDYKTAQKPIAFSKTAVYCYSRQRNLRRQAKVRVGNISQ